MSNRTVYIASSNLPNGLTFSGTTFSVGGTLFQSIDFDGSGYDITGQNFNSISFSTQDYYIAVSQSTIEAVNGTYSSVLIVDPDFVGITSSSFDVVSEFISLDSLDNIQILADSDTSIFSGGQFSLIANDATITIASTQGLVYSGDYSSGFVTYSIVDKNYVDTLFASFSLMQGGTGPTGSNGIDGPTGATGPVGYIGDLLDVDVPTPNNGDVIYWVTSNSQYENASITSILGYTPEDVANKDTDINLTSNSDTLYPSQKAVKTYVDASVTGLIDDRGNYDASSNLWPSTGGSGTSSQILKGDLWYISVAGTLGGSSASVGASIRALTDSPGQTSSNWGVLNVGLGYTPENVANKGVANGYASLDSNGYVPYSQLPKQRVYSTASTTSLIIDTDSYDAIDVTALADGLTFSTPTGTPSNFQKLIVRVKDDGSARALVWDSKFVSRGSTLPTVTSAAKYYTLGFIYNTAGSGTWDLVALAQET